MTPRLEEAILRFSLERDSHRIRVALTEVCEALLVAAHCGNVGECCQAAHERKLAGIEFGRITSP